MRAPPARIRLRSLPAAAGLFWIRRGFRTFWRRPLGFFGLWLFAMLCLFTVTVATLAISRSPAALLSIAALLPLITVGFMAAAEDALDDVRLRPGVFLAALTRDAASRRAMLAIVLVYAGAILLLALGADAIDGGETRRWLQAAMTPGPDGKPPALAPPGDATLSALRFMSLGVMLVSIPLWHAPALVHWGRQGAAQAMFSSVVAVWRTKGAFITFLLGWFVLFVALDTAAQLLAAVFGTEAISLGWLTCQTALSVTYFISMWFCFVDTFEIAAPAAFRTVMASGEPPAP